MTTNNSVGLRSSLQWIIDPAATPNNNSGECSVHLFGHNFLQQCIVTIGVVYNC